MEVVVQIEAETDAHVDPENGQPDERDPAIVTRRPGCSGVYAQTKCPPLPDISDLTTIGRSHDTPTGLHSGRHSLSP